MTYQPHMKAVTAIASMLPDAVLSTNNGYEAAKDYVSSKTDAFFTPTNPSVSTKDNQANGMKTDL